MKIFSAFFFCAFGLTTMIGLLHGTAASIDINSVNAGEVQDFGIWGLFDNHQLYVNVRHIVHKIPAASTRSLPPKQDFVNQNYTLCSGATPWTRPYQYKALPCIDLIEPTPKVVNSSGKAGAGRRRRKRAATPTAPVLVTEASHCTYSDDFHFDICSKLKIQGSGGPSTKLQLCSNAYYIDGNYGLSADGRESCVDLDYCASKYPEGKC